MPYGDFAVKRAISNVSSILTLADSLYWSPDAAGSGSDSDFVAQCIMDAVQNQGYSKDDFFLCSCVGTEDFALDVMQARIASEKKYPDQIGISSTMDENGDYAGRVVTVNDTDHGITDRRSENNYMVTICFTAGQAASNGKNELE